VIDKPAVAITGIGLVTPLGRGLDANWRAVAEGHGALGDNDDGERPRWMQCVGRVEAAEMPPNMPSKLASQARYLNRGGVLAYLAARDAILQAEISQDIPPARRAMYLATGDHTGIACEALYPATRIARAGGDGSVDHELLNRATIDHANPFFLLESLLNNPFSFLSAAFEIMGPGTCLAGQAPCGCHALDLAFRTIRNGRADVALAVGCGSWIDAVALMELADLGLLSGAHLGRGSFRPFDRRRDGFLAGEGGAAVVMESAEQARRRGAEVLAVVEGTSNRAGSDALGASEKDINRCMSDALADAGRRSDELGFVIAHGSGTRDGDRAELRSLQALLEPGCGSVPVCALKPLTGHMGAASDVAEVVLGMAAAQSGVVPATLNFQAPDAEFADLGISARQQRVNISRFLSHNLGLGGQSGAIVVRVPSQGGADGP